MYGRNSRHLVRDVPFLDKDVIEVGGKVFPRSLSYVQEGKPIVQVWVTELTTADSFPPSLFEPPAGAVSRSGCMNPSPAHLSAKVAPKYPDLERSSRTEGEVAIYALVGSDGVPQNFQVVSGVTPGLNQASLDAVKQWRYSASTCDGVPVALETVIVVNYRIGR